MGNVLGCSGSRSGLKQSFKTQVKLLEVLNNITLQEFENKIKKFAYNGILTQNQLAEMLSYHQLRSRDNTLLSDILLNPFFHASEKEIKRAKKVGINITRKEKKETIERLEKEFEDSQNENRVLTLGNEDETSPLQKVHLDAKTHQTKLDDDQNCSHNSCDEELPDDYLRYNKIQKQWQNYYGP